MATWSNVHVTWRIVSPILSLATVGTVETKIKFYNFSHDYVIK